MISRISNPWFVRTTADCDCGTFTVICRTRRALTREFSWYVNKMKFYTIDTFRCHYNFTLTSEYLVSAQVRYRSNVYKFCDWWNEGCCGGCNGFHSLTEFSCVKRENSSLKWLESWSHYKEFTVMVSCSVSTN